MLMTCLLSTRTAYNSFGFIQRNIDLFSSIDLRLANFIVHLIFMATVSVNLDNNRRSSSYLVDASLIVDINHMKSRNDVLDIRSNIR